MNAASRKFCNVSDNSLILLDRVSKRFYCDRNRRESLRNRFIRAISRVPRDPQTKDYTIADVSFRIGPAESIAIIGDNGSGKSTLIRLIANIYAPSEGCISTHGRIATVLELGAGFHKELTGADNLAMYAAALGLTRIELLERIDAMIHFADIGDVLHKPIKHYSTGMQARLALAVALCGIFDAVLLDEAMSVGDYSFRVKVENHVRNYVSNGGTVVLVSHDLDLLQRTCTRALWLNDGKIVLDGPVDKVVSAYQNSKGNRLQQPH